MTHNTHRLTLPTPTLSLDTVDGVLTSVNCNHFKLRLIFFYVRMTIVMSYFHIIVMCKVAITISAQCLME